ncbi:hypothetical protein ETB97_010349 [Aspergillus alliaceus]|uniref:DRBM domain-containing protein n=1 Tax=Petromyces alliaceus TaxID=209559 RepID=A0A5N7C0L3_PETAA|nr:uncharacterized protein BDW43DRAFT_313401 [Aspergillus alliaceus]KAB8231071.1 hypothetical protein BDW43DRAFT_313401 [Aspergillus alliaceus]KAE8387621.1 hypothetical protein BDV23DRAFT_186169 [Aspergillus alliaceus]KAF5854998.1 hypothetical protein ETB97_010349 [Aspergillus burnettii]
MPVQNVPPANNGNVRSSWQEQLKEHCRSQKLQEPVFNIYTERRGGRTAWTCVVLVQGRQYSAQFWYDGNYINNAKEDAAEKALNVLIPQTSRNTAYQGQMFPQASTTPAYSRQMPR